MRLIAIIITALLLAYNPMSAQNEKGDAEFKEGLGYLKQYNKKGSRLALADAIKTLKIAADKNNAEACFYLFNIYWAQDIEGIDIDRSDVQWAERGDWSNLVFDEWPTRKWGFEYLKKAADLGHLKAVSILAYGYYSIEWAKLGAGSWEENKSRAYDLCKKYIDSGDAVLEQLMGNFYEEGYRVEKNYHEAIKWYEKAYSHGVQNVTAKTGALYYKLREFSEAEKSFELYFKNANNNKSWRDLFKDDSWKYIMWFESCIGANKFDKAISVLNKIVSPKVSGLKGSDIQNWNPSKANILYQLENLLEDFYNQNGIAYLSPFLKHVYSVDPNPSPEICYSRAQKISSFSCNSVLTYREQYFIQALEWFEKAKPYKNETGEFCCWVGNEFLKRDEIGYAKNWYEKAVNYGESWGYRFLAELYEKNDKRLPDEGHLMAFENWKKFAESNNAYGYYQLGRYYDEGRISARDIEMAKKCFRSAANLNAGEVSFSAMDNLASCHIENKEWNDAFAWLNKAYQKGYLPVCHNLGDMYFYGNGTSQSYEKAFEIFNKGISEYPICKYRVAVMLAQGLGTAKDLELSNKLLREAADAGVGRAKYVLGMNLYSGQDIEQDYKSSIKILNEALEDEYLPQNFKGEIYRKLSACYRFGRGIDKNESKADEYLNLAVSCGDLDTQKLLEWLKIK